MPDWRAPLAARLKPLALRPAREHEIIDELSQHLDDRYRELLAVGAADDEAVRLALDELDDEQLLAREMRRLRRSLLPEPVPPGQPVRSWMADARHDLVYAVRMLRKSPGFSAAAVLTLALGIGANSAMFSLIDGTLLQRLPVRNPDRLLNVFRDGGAWHSVSYPAYVSIRDGARLIEGLAAWGPITASLNVDGETNLVSGAIVSGNFFDLLAMPAERGRLLSPRDDVTPMAHPVAVISHRLWKGRFGGRPDIVGSSIRLNGTIFTIVGVVPAGFNGPRRGAMSDVYVPMMMQPLMRRPARAIRGKWTQTF